MSRLIDADTSKYRSLKQVVVVGEPGSCMDAVTSALKVIGLTVYDTVAMTERRERDLALWIEAARLRNSRTPYNRSDFDKLIGSYAAISGVPACYFGKELVELYPGIKVVMVTSGQKTSMSAMLRTKMGSLLHTWVGHEYHGSLAEFADIASTRFDAQAIRGAVREKNLLEIEDLRSWDSLCEFLKAHVPPIPVPSAVLGEVSSTQLAQPFSVARTLKRGCAMATILAAFLLFALITEAQKVAGVWLGACFAVEGLHHMVGKPSLIGTIAPMTPPVAVVQTAPQADSLKPPKVNKSNAPAPPTITEPYMLTLALNPKAFFSGPDLRSCHYPHSATTVSSFHTSTQASVMTTTSTSKSASTHPKAQKAPGPYFRGRKTIPRSRHSAGTPVLDSTRPMRKVIPGWGDVQAIIKKDDDSVRTSKMEKAKEFEGVYTKMVETYKSRTSGSKRS